MTFSHLLDTNALSEPLRPIPDPRLLDFLDRKRGCLATASPVWQELQYGCHRLPLSERRNKIELYLAGQVLPKIPILPYDAAAAAWFGRERARLSLLGKTPPLLDGQIAAVAATNDLILVTRNEADFAGFEGLTVENWRRP